MTFRTIKRPSEGLYRESGSRFLGFAYPVKDELSVKQKLEELRKKFYDAHHHCYAYILGMEEQRYRSNDDGEPSHSAGDPILGQIRSADLTNVLVVVVRYFGGTKLGVGGLIRAYRTAAQEALSGADILAIFPQTKIKVNYEYQQTSDVERILDMFDFQDVDRTFTDTCSFCAVVPTSDLNRIRTDLSTIGVGVEVLTS